MNAWRQLIEARMTERRLSTSDLARRSGLSRQTLYSILTNDDEMIRDLPGRKTIDALAAALELPMEQLLVAAAEAWGIPVNATVVVQTLTDVSDSALARELLDRALHREAAGRNDVATAPDLSNLDPGSVLALAELRRKLLADADGQRQTLPGLSTTLEYIAELITAMVDAAVSEAG